MDIGGKAIWCTLPGFILTTLPTGMHFTCHYTKVTVDSDFSSLGVKFFINLNVKDKDRLIELYNYRDFYKIKLSYVKLYKFRNSILNCKKLC
jgi:hypothetical protein